MVDPQPTKYPEWNRTGGNRTEPLEAEKDAGWSVNDQPPSSYFNWLQYYTGAWLKWLNERVYKGTNEVDLTINALQPDTSGDGGDLIIRSGAPNTSGTSGDITIEAPTGTSGGGNISILAGPSSTTGGGGDITITGGAGPSGQEGGDIAITAGASADTNGGDLTLAAGSATGTNRLSGVVTITTGSARGNQGGQIELLVAEAGSTGSAQYALFEGLDGSKQIYLNRYVRFQNSDAIDNTRGSFRCLPKATIPTAIQRGDVYMDTNTDQLRVWGTSSYYGLNSKVFALDLASQSVIDTLGGEKVFLRSAGGDLKYTIKANYLKSDSIIRVFAAFLRTTTGALLHEPGFRIRLGDYSVPNGVLLTEITSDSGSSIYTRFTIDLDVHVRTGGGAGACRARTQAHAVAGGSSSWLAPKSRLEVRDLTSIVFTGALDLFPTVVWGSTNSQQSMTCTHFTVDII
jgi:hypothetical protein